MNSDIITSLSTFTPLGVTSSWNSGFIKIIGLRSLSITVKSLPGVTMTLTWSHNGADTLYEDIYSSAFTTFTDIFPVRSEYLRIVINNSTTNTLLYVETIGSKGLFPVYQKLTYQYSQLSVDYDVFNNTPHNTDSFYQVPVTAMSVTPGTYQISYSCSQYVKNSDPQAAVQYIQACVYDASIPGPIPGTITLTSYYRASSGSENIRDTGGNSAMTFIYVVSTTRTLDISVLSSHNVNLVDWMVTQANLTLVKIG